jgi:undecaprenyl-diphosphatase
MGDFDMHGLRALYGGTTGPVAAVMIAATLLGGRWALTLLVPLVAWAKTRRLAAYLGAATAVQAVVVWLLKRLFGRVRPWLALGLPPPPGSPHDPSLPSGHAAGAFCVAAFAAVALHVTPSAGPWRTRLLSALALLVAGLIAISRVYLGAHFPSDVLAGALIGALIGGFAGKAYAEGDGTV